MVNQTEITSSNNYMLTGLWAIAVIFLLTGCGGLDQPAGQKPRSNFVAAQTILRVKADESIQIESYHLSQNSKLGQVEVWVNGQLVRSEQTAGQTTFRGNLADVQVLGWPAQIDSGEFVIFPSSTCDFMGEMGQARSINPVGLEHPSSTWSLCHTWIGFIPGTYDMSLQATDRDGNQGQRITQRIEVLE